MTYSALGLYKIYFYQAGSNKKKTQNTTHTMKGEKRIIQQQLEFLFQQQQQ